MKFRSKLPNGKLRVTPAAPRRLVQRAPGGMTAGNGAEPRESFDVRPETLDKDHGATPG
jgi:hypothetical protein